MCLDTDFFQLTLHQDLICPICLGALCINSVVDENEHCYCRSCIHRWIKRGNGKCPVGKEDITLKTLRPVPRIIKNLLSDSTVFCKFRDEGCDIVIKYEYILKHESRCKYNPYNPLNRSRFDPKSVSIKTDRIEASNLVKLPSNSLYRMAFCNNGTQIAMPDELNSIIHICDLNGNLIESKDPDGIIDQPIGICILTKEDGDEEIYIGDCAEHKVFVFDSNFTLKNTFGDNRLKIPQYILIDDENVTNKYLYASDFSNDEITIWNTQDGQFIDYIKVNSPFTIRFDASHIYAVSPTEFKLNDENRVEKIEKGGNCIFIIKKIKPYDVVKEIKFDNWLCPSSLHICNEMKIYTVAYDLDSNGVKSEYKSLFIIDLNGNICKKIILNDIQIIGDMLVFQNKLVFSVRSAIRVLQFENINLSTIEN